MKKVKKICLGLLVSAVLAAIVLSILAVVYEEEIEQFALDRIQSGLVAEVSVDEIDFSVWQKFPQASLVCDNVLIHETINAKDTLIFASKVFLEFSILDMLKGNYTVNTVSLENGIVNIRRLEDGRDNYHFWKEGEASSSELSFVLEQVQLKNVKASVIDEKAEFSISTFAEEVKLKGAFANKAFDMIAEADLLIHEITVADERYVSEKKILADFVLQVNDGDHAYYLSSGKFKLEGIPFEAKGSFIDLTEGVMCDLDVKGEALDIEELMTHLPESAKESLVAYRGRGELDIEGTISGMAGANSQPDVSLTFSIGHGKFTHLESGVAMSDIRAEGLFEKLYGLPEKLTIQQFHADFESGTFAVLGVVEDFNEPWIDLQMRGHFDLNDLRKFAELDQLDELSGNISANANFKGRLGVGGAVDNTVLSKALMEGQVEFEDGHFRVAGAPHAFEELNGKFTLKNRNATIDRFSGRVEGSDFALTGEFANLVPFMILPEEKLNITANFRSGALDFNALLLADEGGSEAPYHLEFPTHIDFNLDVNIQHLTFREFVAEKLVGKAQLKNQVLTLDPVSLNTAEGSFVAKATIDGRQPDRFLLTSNASLTGMNITRLFEEFENFGQDFIGYANLRGKATADVKFTAEFNSALEFRQDNLYSLAEVTIDNGELIDLRSMKHISTYVKGNKLIAPFVNEEALDTKLSHIYFSSLSNQIEIKDGKVYLPEMTIRSSAMDITAQGQHSFSNAIDYTIGFKIRDVMSKGNNTEFGEVADDGLSNSFFLSMTGTSDNPEFGYDRIAHKEKRQEDRQNELKNAKQILKEELGLFKGDETLGTLDKKEQPVTPAKITVVVDDDDKKKEKNRRLLGKEDKKLEIKTDKHDDDDDDF